MMDRVDQATQTMIKNLEEKTGKSLQAWIELARLSQLTRHRQLLDFLKSEHGLTYGYASLVAAHALQADQPAGAGEADLVEAQYAGDKSGLKPIYQALIAAVQAFGEDVVVAPKKSYVSLRANTQFGIIQPTTKTRLDVGLVLKNTPASGRLEAAGSFNTMMSHRVRLESLEEIDAELCGWLKMAYEAAK